MLDNNSSNLRVKVGTCITGGNSTTLYLKSRLLERELKGRLKDQFDYSIDLNIFVDKILEKVTTIEVCEVIRDYHMRSSKDQFVAEASKIKSFMIKMKKIAGSNDAEKEDDDAYYRCEDDDGDIEEIL